MKFNGPITMEVWLRMAKVGEEKYGHTRNIYGVGTWEVIHVVKVVGCSVPTAYIWLKRARQNRPVYPSNFIEKIAEVLNTPLASDHDMLNKLAYDPTYWASLQPSFIEGVKATMEDAIPIRIENERLAIIAKAEAERKSEEKRKEQARLAVIADAKAEEERIAKVKADALNGIEEKTREIERNTEEIRRLKLVAETGITA